VPASIWLG